VLVDDTIQNMQAAISGLMEAEDTLLALHSGVVRYVTGLPTEQAIQRNIPNVSVPLKILNSIRHGRRIPDGSKLTEEVN
jgi:hypothetical protein